MEKKEKSAKFLNQRKFFLFVPLLVLPFLTLFFWSLGGGQTAEAQDKQSDKDGLNTNIPGAYIKKDQNPDKMSYYDMAKRDSDALKGRIASDPNLKKAPENIGSGISGGNEPYNSSGYGAPSAHLNTSLSGGTFSRDKNETKVYQKLDQLNYALNTQATPKPVQQEMFKPSTGTGVNSADIDRLEKMMKAMGQKDGDDPELQQINSMLEKILDVQHPDRVQEKIRATSEKKRGQVFPVSASINPNQVNLFTGGNGIGSNIGIQGGMQGNGFFSLEDPSTSVVQENAITAVVHDDQEIVNGSTVKLRLTTDVFINGVLIPKDNFLFGIANLSGDRLNINISNLQYLNSLYPVSLSIYDIDGLPGIYIPDAISRTVAKQSADQAIGGFGMTSLDPSLGAQAASAGIEAAKTIISKKVRLIKVTVKAGYQVLLRDGQGQ